MSEISNSGASYRLHRAEVLRAGGAYRHDDERPPVGTRVVHEELGAGAVADFGVQPNLGQWWVEFDVPLGDGETRLVWVYPHLLRPEVK